jgi:ABC-type glycerol-3-phosphate transport system substrate-binding protein
MPWIYKDRSIPKKEKKGRMCASKKAITKMWAIAIAAVIIIAAFGGASYYYITTSTPNQVTLKVLMESAPEPLGTFDANITKMWEEQNPNIKISLDIVPRDSFYEKARRVIMEKPDTYDIIQVHCTVELPLAIEQKAIHFASDIGIVASEYLEQTEEKFIYLNRDPKTNKLTSWPQLMWNTYGVFYRKDLYEDPLEKAAFEAQYGYALVPPTTWSQMRDVSEFFTRPNDNLYGSFIGGVSWSISSELFPTLCLSNGGKLMDANGNITINSPEVIEAMEFLKEMSAFSPSGWEAEDMFSGIALFSEGKIATLPMWQFCWPDFFNPAKVSEKVLGNVGMIAMPKSPIGRSLVPFLPHALAIPINAPHLEEAKKFLNWLQTFEVQKKIALTGMVFIPVRKDVAADADVKKLLHTEVFPYPGQEYQELVPPGPPKFLLKWSITYDPTAEALLKFIRNEWTAQEALDWLEVQLKNIYAS